MNRKGQFEDVGDIIKLILVIVILIPFIGAIFSLINSMNKPLPSCDYSQYEETIANLSNQLTFCLNQSQEIVHVNQTVEVPRETQIVYRDRSTGDTIIEISLWVIIFVSITLFKIKLPKKIEKEVEKYEDWIKVFKIVSLILVILIAIRLIWVFFSLF
jgi:hypothetical protein